MKMKALVILLLLTTIGEFLWIKYVATPEFSIGMPNFHFSDYSDSLVSAKGSWVSNTELASPIQTINIECWKQFGHCFIVDATLSPKGDYLSTDTEYAEIVRWDKDVIETKPNPTGLGCVEYFYRLDRRTKVVTGTRKTLKTTGACAGIDSEPMVLTLTDGLERVAKYRNQ